MYQIIVEILTACGKNVDEALTTSLMGKGSTQVEIQKWIESGDTTETKELAFKLN